MVVFFAGSCKKFDGDITTPAFLHLDSLVVQQQGVGAPSTDAGWYTSDIDAVQLVAYFQGDGAETNLGTFQLPCEVPVLREGTVDYLRVVPVVKQNGIALTRIEYPYYADTTLRNLTLVANQTTYIGTLDGSTGRHYLPIYYKPLSLIDQLVFEPFEPLATTIAFDTSIAGVEWIDNDPDNAFTGSGYLKITTPADDYNVLLPLKDPLTVSDPTKIIYLEMDYRTDVHLRIGINSAYTSGGTASTAWAITLYPRSQWGKIYINLGKLWAQFNHYPEFRLLISTLNTDGKGGETLIDNLKIITI
ncbi:MAG: hypothetical protein IJ620_06610 [Bacteroidales bacterium]|nr:hypothetical protein [Bacteroidales bacterium]